jgi:phosphopantetheine adenylyltransferase
MSELSNFLVESILGESAEMENVIVVYSGRFQPFHKGHFATYKQLVSKFGKDDVYIATSNKTDNQKSPFDFREKKTIMTRMFGIPSNKIVQVKNPYQPTEIVSSYDAAKTGLIVVVGEKDEQRLGGNYFTPYKGKVEMGYLDKGYVYASPSQPNPISGTDVRNWLGKGTEEEKKEGFLKAYPKFDATVFKFITLKLAKLSEDINLDVNVGDTLLMGKFKNKRVVVKNIDKDEHGMPTINGKKATTFRIPPKSNLFNESSNFGMAGAEPGEPNPNYVADGQARILDKGKPEGWFKQGGYTQMDIPKGDWMRGKGRKKESESTYRKVTYKLKN